MAPEIDVSEEAALPKYKMKNRAQSNYSNRLDQLDFTQTQYKIDSKLRKWNNHMYSIRLK